MHCHLWLGRCVPYSILCRWYHSNLVVPCGGLRIQLEVMVVRVHPVYKHGGNVKDMQLRSDCWFRVNFHCISFHNFRDRPGFSLFVFALGLTVAGGGGWGYCCVRSVSLYTLNLAINSDHFVTWTLALRGRGRVFHMCVRMQAHVLTWACSMYLPFSQGKETNQQCSSYISDWFLK